VKEKILVAGNGGSLCDAMHFAEELTGLYRNKRPALPAIALSDPGHMSCVGNDLGYDQVFSRAVEALGKKGDVLVLLTTSGNSSNLIKAAQAAKEKGLSVIAFLGKTGGKMKGMGDLEWIVSGFSYSDRIQEVQMAAIHMIIEMVEEELFHAS
jgi:D-sedoheptulose 7-phosphate isomerase